MNYCRDCVFLHDNQKECIEASRVSTSPNRRACKDFRTRETHRRIIMETIREMRLSGNYDKDTEEKLLYTLFDDEDSFEKYLRDEKEKGNIPYQLKYMNKKP